MCNVEKDLTMCLCSRRIPHERWESSALGIWFQAERAEDSSRAAGGSCWPKGGCHGWREWLFWPMKKMNKGNGALGAGLLRTRVELLKRALQLLQFCSGFAKLSFGG